MQIVIRSQKIGEVRAELLPEQAPRTVEAIIKALPIKAQANRWGKEVYFSIPVNVPQEKGVETVEKGAIGYWPPGKALCIFFGPTPASRSPAEIRPASPVTVVGRVLGDPEVFDQVKDGDQIEILA